MSKDIKKTLEKKYNATLAEELMKPILLFALVVFAVSYMFSQLLWIIISAAVCGVLAVASIICLILAAHYRKQAEAAIDESALDIE